MRRAGASDAAGPGRVDVVALLDEFAAHWALVARSLADAPNVLMHELINEPWAGDAYRDPLLLIPGVAGQRSLTKPYEALARAIRKVDAETAKEYAQVRFRISS